MSINPSSVISAVGTLFSCGELTFYLAKYSYWCCCCHWLAIAHANCPWAEECLPEGLILSQHQIISSLIAPGFVPSIHPVWDRTQDPSLGSTSPLMWIWSMQQDLSKWPLHVSAFFYWIIKLLQKKKALTGASRQNYKSISSVIDKQCVSMKLGCLNQGTQTFSLMQFVYFCCSLILKTFHVLCGLQPYGLTATDSSALDNFLQAICEPANMGIPWA